MSGVLYFWKSPYVWFNRSSAGFLLLLHLICYFGWSRRRKFGLTQIRSWKVSILRVFSYNLEYSLILHQNSTALLWGMNESEKCKSHLTVVMKIILTSWTPERDPWLSPEHTLRPPTARIRLCSIVSQGNVMTEWQLCYLY